MGPGPVWTVELDERDKVALKVGSRKALPLQLWVLGCLARGEASCHALRRLEQPCGEEAHMEKSHGLQPTPSTTCQPHE